MITVKEFINTISASELYNLAWVDELSGELTSNRVNTILSFINEGLLALYDRFALKKDQIYLFPYTGKFVYKISSEHMMESSLKSDYTHYLWKGVNETFTDNLIRIVNVFTSSGFELPLNDYSLRFHVSTPYYNVIQLSDYEKDWKFSITYAASPDKIKNLDDKIDIPSVLIPVLTSYVAYKAYNTINTPESSQITSKYLQLYTSQIDSLVFTDSVNQEKAEVPFKFIRGGWR